VADQTELVSCRYEIANCAAGRSLELKRFDLEVGHDLLSHCLRVSWLVWLPLILGPNGLKTLKTAVSFPVFVCIGTLGPLLACFIVHRWYAGNWRAVRWAPSVPFQWIWLILGPLLIIFCRVFLFSALYTQGGPGSWRWHYSALVGILIPMFNYNLFGGPPF
jgi:hypothetical protein